jgi:predicted kinase
VNLEQLDVALDHGVDAVQVGLSAHDDGPVRDGVVGRCLERGVWLLAHSPLGGPKRSANLIKRAPVGALLAGVLHHGPVVSVVVGATRPEHAAALGGPFEGAADLRSAFPALRTVADRRVAAPAAEGEVVLLMGLQGSGKSTRAQAWVDAGYVRFNRDLAGGTLRGLAAEVASALDGGARRVVLDNTYLTRRSRADVLEIARARGVPVRGVWIDVPPDVAAANVVLRQVDALGRLLDPAELNGKTNLALPPSALNRAAREVELPAEDEGFAALERVPFVRAPGRGVPIRVLAADAALTAGPDARPTFVMAWSPDGAPPPSPWPTLLCPHGGGPPVCWCRPPLPGLLALAAHAAGGALDQSEVIGGGPSFRRMAASVGAAWRPA